MKKLLIVFVCVCICSFTLTSCGACVSDSDVTKAVEKQGYTDVKIKSKHIFTVEMRGCSGSDDAAYKITATNSQGKRVGLTVCAGWPFKGVTVRSK